MMTGEAHEWAAKEPRLTPCRLLVLASRATAFGPACALPTTASACVRTDMHGIRVQSQPVRLLAAEAELWQAAQPPPRRITHAHRQQWAALPTLGV